MKQRSNYALRLPKSLKAGIEKAAREDGVSFNQFMVSAAAEKLSALQTMEYFVERAGRGSLSRFDEIMARGGGETPIAGDER
ncbi:MAG: toxin-antitoxin system HicB family antitoxin [Alphaproteobacteria bacterium]|nr:toxin-antitoxin system HicB family antitoxin [Alphaproteobacteria bacterium]